MLPSSPRDAVRWLAAGAALVAVGTAVYAAPALSAPVADGSAAARTLAAGDPVPGTDQVAARRPEDRKRHPVRCTLHQLSVSLPAALAERTGRRRGLRIVDVVPGSPADRAGLKAGDLVLEADRRPVAEAQSLQRLLFADAIGRPLPVTVSRRGAMVDVVTVPTELTGG